MKSTEVRLPAHAAGSGPAGRITASDIEAFKKGPAAPPSTNGAAAAPSKPAPPPPGPSAAPASAAAPAPAAGTAGTTVAELRGTTQPFTSLQSAVSKNMVESLKVGLQCHSPSHMAACGHKGMVKTL